MPTNIPPASDPLEALFQALAAEERGSGDDPVSGDPLETVRRIEAGEAADDPSLRRVLADVADAVAGAVAGAATTPPLAPDLRRAVLAAYEARVGETPRVGVAPRLVPAASAPTPPASVPGTRRWTPLYRAAALLLIALGVGLFLASRGEARAALRVAGVDLVALDGSQREVGSSRTLPVGTALGGTDRKFLVLTLESGGRLVLGPGDDAEIVGVPRDGGHVGRVALGVGCMLLDATGGVAEIDLGGERPFSLVEGRAVLRRTKAGVVVVPEASAAFRIGPGTKIRRGASSLLIPHRGRIEAYLGPVDASAFPLFPSSRPSQASVDDAWRVAPRRWRVALGAYERRGPSLRLDPTGVGLVLAWTPFSALRTADALDLQIHGGPAFVRARLDGVEAVPLDPESGVTRVHLPPSWFDDLAGEELEIELTWPDASKPPQPVYFEDATFRRAVLPAPTGESDEPR